MTGAGRDRNAAIRTSASGETGTGPVFSGRATQIFQGQLSHLAKPLHLGSKPRHDEEPRTEEHRAVKVDDRQRVALACTSRVAPRGGSDLG